MLILTQKSLNNSIYLQTLFTNFTSDIGAAKIAIEVHQVFA